MLVDCVRLLKRSIFTHEIVRVYGWRTMRHGTNSKGAPIPPYSQNSGAHIVNTGIDSQAAEESPGNSYLLLGRFFSSTLSYRTSCREELAKPLPFFQGSLKDMGHKILFLLL